MNAGLPGTGLGGLFYIVGALWMPVDAVYNRLRGRKTVPWRVVLRQAGIAVGVIAALWLTGWGIGYLIALQPALAFSRGGAGAYTALQVSSVVRWAGVFGTAGLLAIVVGVVQVMRLAVPRPSRETQ